MIIVGALAAILTLASGLPQQLPTGDSASAAYASAIEHAPPPFELPSSLRDRVGFGWIVVPRDHGDPAAGTMRLAFSVLRARAKSPKPDPIVFVPGGPGLAAVEPWTVEAARSPRIALLREQRDFIILDPRGHGLSQPRPCSELKGAAPLVDGLPASETWLVAQLQKCRVQMEADGFSPRALNAVQAAHDIEILRRALGVDQINLFGASYGARIVAEFLRRHRSGVRAAVLLSPLPPGLPHLDDDTTVLAEVLPTLFRRCAEVRECRTAFPQLRSDYDSLMARIRREPLDVGVPESRRVPAGSLHLDEATLKRAFAQLLATRSTASGVPMLIHTLAHHGFDAVSHAVPQLLNIFHDDDIAFGAHMAFLCNDSPIPAETASWLYLRCPSWVGQDFGDRSPESLKVDVPVLVMVGEFDPSTPPSYARQLAAGVSGSRLIEVPWYGHDLQHPCISGIQRDFFNTPAALPNTECLDSLPNLHFAGRVVPSRWVASMTMRAQEHGPYLGFAGLLLLVTVAGLPASAWRGRRNGGRPDGSQRVLVWLTTTTALTLLIATGVAVRVGASQSPLLPAIGVTPAWRWVIPLPWPLYALTVATVVLMARRTAQADRSTRVLCRIGMAGVLVILALWAHASFA